MAGRGAGVAAVTRRMLELLPAPRTGCRARAGPGRGPGGGTRGRRSQPPAFLLSPCLPCSERYEHLTTTGAALKETFRRTPSRLNRYNVTRQVGRLRTTNLVQPVFDRPAAADGVGESGRTGSACRPRPSLGRHEPSCLWYGGRCWPGGEGREATAAWPGRSAAEAMAGTEDYGDRFIYLGFCETKRERLIEP